VTRAEALTAAAGIIGKHVADIGGLAELLEIAGIKRLAARLREISCARPAEVGCGRPRPDPDLWSRRRL
jgi:hypothetical protein